MLSWFNSLRLFEQTRLRKSEVEEMARMLGTELIDSLEVRSENLFLAASNFLDVSSSAGFENGTRVHD